jgi:hypothetical protein
MGGGAADEHACNNAAVIRRKVGIDRADDPPEGHSEAENRRLGASFAEDLAEVRAALARGNIDSIKDEMDALLEEIGQQVEPNFPSRRALAAELLKQHGRAAQDIVKRHQGGVIETPQWTPSTSAARALSGKAKADAGASTISAAFRDWRGERERPAETSGQVAYAVRVFLGLHGDIAVASMHRGHAHGFARNPMATTACIDETSAI